MAYNLEENYLRNRTMTEFELATLAFQKATLELQKSSLEVQYYTVWVAGVVGFAQCSLIGVGLWIMRRAANARDKALDILMKQTMDSSKRLDILMKRAEEDSLALRTLIERTSK